MMLIQLLDLLQELCQIVMEGYSFALESLWS